MKKKIDLMSAIGLFSGVALIVFSIMLVKNTGEGAGGYSITTINLGNFFDPPSIVIVLGGVIATLMLSFPLEQFARVPKHLRIIFMPQAFRPDEYIDILTECAKKARINGLLALEENVNEIENAFLKNSLQMVVDSIDPEKVKLQMESWIDSVDERHTQERAFYDKGAALAPAFGMIGTLIGLINMLKVLEDVEVLGRKLGDHFYTLACRTCSKRGVDNSPSHDVLSYVLMVDQNILGDVAQHQDVIVHSLFLHRQHMKAAVLECQSDFVALGEYRVILRISHLNLKYGMVGQLHLIEHLRAEVDRVDHHPFHQSLTRMFRDD